MVVLREGFFVAEQKRVTLRRSKTFAIAYPGINALLMLPESDDGMNMIWHYYIPYYVASLCH